MVLTWPMVVAVVICVLRERSENHTWGGTRERCSPNGEYGDPYGALRILVPTSSILLLAGVKIFLNYGYIGTK